MLETGKYSIKVPASTWEGLPAVPSLGTQGRGKGQERERELMSYRPHQGLAFQLLYLIVNLTSFQHMNLGACQAVAPPPPTWKEGRLSLQ